MTNFTNIFGGNNISPSQLSYRAVALSANTTLYWPLNATTSSDLVAQKMDVTPAGASLALTIPDATLVSAGTDVWFSNLGAQTYTVKDSAGTVILTVAAGTVWLLYLTSNATSAGTWNALQMGSTTSSATAASLAGLGLLAITTTLNQSHPVTSTAISRAFVANDRAQTIVSTGGAITFTLMAAVTAGNNWFTFVKNYGTGNLTVSGATIDGATSLTLSVGDSAIIVCDGSVYYTIGKSLSASANVTSVSINLAGTGTYTLSSTEAAARIQTFTGTLTGNRIVEYGTAPGFWYVYNNDNGAFTTTVRVNSLDTGVVIPQTAYAILRSDGTNLTLGATLTTFAAGTVGAPGLAVTGDTDTGIWQSAANTLDFTTNGANRLKLNSSGATIPTGDFIATLGGLTLSAGVVTAQATGTNVSQFTHRGYFVTNAPDTPTFRVEGTAANWTTSSLLRITCATVGAAGWFLIDGYSAAGDREFHITGDGDGFCEGSWTGGGGDYAEYFETEDGQPIPPGKAVVMADGMTKVRIAAPGDIAFGVTRPKHGGGVAFVAGRPEQWPGKFVKDSYGGVIRNNKGERVISEAYDSAQVYVTRDKRPEWVLVGYLGKCPVDDGEVIPDTWKKCGPVSQGVTMYLVK